jgi:hypothetical protein
VRTPRLVELAADRDPPGAGGASREHVPGDPREVGVRDEPAVAVAGVPERRGPHVAAPLDDRAAVRLRGLLPVPLVLVLRRREEHGRRHPAGPAGGVDRAVGGGDPPSAALEVFDQAEPVECPAGRPVGSGDDDAVRGAVAEQGERVGEAGAGECAAGPVEVADLPYDLDGARSGPRVDRGALHVGGLEASAGGAVADDADPDVRDRALTRADVHGDHYVSREHMCTFRLRGAWPLYVRRAFDVCTGYTGGAWERKGPAQVDLPGPWPTRRT